jgi:hypothetical protein
VVDRDPDFGFLRHAIAPVFATGHSIASKYQRAVNANPLFLNKPSECLNFRATSLNSFRAGGCDAAFGKRKLL